MISQVITGAKRTSRTSASGIAADELSQPVSGCNVELRDATDAVTATCVTDASGACEVVGFEFTDHQVNGRIDFNPHTVHVTKDASTDQQPITLDQSDLVAVLSVTTGAENVPPSDVENLARSCERL